MHPTNKRHAPRGINQSERKQAIRLNPAQSMDSVPVPTRVTKPFEKKIPFRGNPGESESPITIAENSHGRKTVKPLLGSGLGSGGSPASREGIMYDRSATSTLTTSTLTRDSGHWMSPKEEEESCSSDEDNSSKEVTPPDSSSGSSDHITNSSTAADHRTQIQLDGTHHDSLLCLHESYLMKRMF
eukprot:CAMPEP_0170168402 /NCGR_PEP_ID=MMETSP0040_2-20121228/1453_1 /TAXON_ID=641309 /ORGANISM="Lotharella oceanica, Strain CCMP622" /LENGTH=184 /DNA_ID=CAMNT_0010406641 /DNA_START=324 /DNA_END=878 /DNA_ORIENTATION=+